MYSLEMYNTCTCNCNNGMQIWVEYGTMSGCAAYTLVCTVFCPGYLEWWLDSMHLVLFSTLYMYYLRGG